MAVAGTCSAGNSGSGAPTYPYTSGAYYVAEMSVVGSYQRSLEMQNFLVLESTSPSRCLGNQGTLRPHQVLNKRAGTLCMRQDCGQEQGLSRPAGCVVAPLTAYLAALFPGLHPCTFPLLSCHSAPRSTEQAVENAILATLFLVNPLEAPTATTFSLTRPIGWLCPRPCHFPFPSLHLRVRHHELPFSSGWARPGLRLPTSSAPLSLLSDMDIVLVSALLTFH